MGAGDDDAMSLAAISGPKRSLHGAGSVALCATSSARSAVDQSRSDTLTGIIGARRAWTVSMISALSMPCR